MHFLRSCYRFNINNNGCLQRSLWAISQPLYIHSYIQYYLCKVICIFLCNKVIYCVFDLVAPIVQVVSLIVWRSAEMQVTLQCYVEASPKSLTMWQRGKSQSGKSFYSFFINLYIYAKWNFWHAIKITMFQISITLT